jgi:hypothetical protein
VTAVVALCHPDGLIIGADSAGVAGLSLTVRSDDKVFATGEYLIGFTTSFRMGQLLRYDWHPPDRPEGLGDMAFMVRTVVPSIRALLKDGGFSTIDNNTEDGGTFLLGYRGQIYHFGGDFQVGQARCGYDAVGCGFELSLGSLHATSELLGTDPRNRVLLALQAAEAHSAGVRGPFTILEQRWPATPPVAQKPTTPTN